MHEFSIAMAIVDQVVDVAEQNDASKVDKVEVQAGVIRQIIPEMLQTAWQSAIIDTVAEGSELILTESRAAVKCRECYNEYEPDVDDFICPQCGKADAEILQGDEIILKSVECTCPRG